MPYRSLPLFLLLGALFQASASRAEPFDPRLRTRGRLWTTWALDTHFDEGDLASEDWLESLTRFELESRWRTEGGGRWVLGVSGHHSLRSGDETVVSWEARPEKVYFGGAATGNGST